MFGKVNPKIGYINWMKSWTYKVLFSVNCLGFFARKRSITLEILCIRSFIALIALCVDNGL